MPIKTLLSFVLTTFVLSLPAGAQPAHSAMAVVTDIRGRTVTVPMPARRILIDDGRYLIALSLIHPDPVSVIAAWPHDVNRIGAWTYEQYRRRFPRIATIPRIASSAERFSLEQVLAIKPDVAVFTLTRGPSDAQLQQFAAAGIPVVFIDFFTHPFENVDPSLRLLGELTGLTAEADAFIAFRQEHLDHIKAVLDRAKPPVPRVFLEAHAGMTPDCCNSPGKGNIGDYITFVGGHNIGADVLPGAAGRVSVEYIVSQNPEVYIATGGPHLEKTGGLVLGPGYSVDRARAALRKMTERPGISLIPAVKAGRVYGLAHQLLNSPLDILAVEALARWIQPDLFRDVDPDRTLAEMNRRFLVVPLDGVQWIALR